jgi:hypothetical protein
MTNPQAEEPPVRPAFKSLVDLWSANKLGLALVGLGAAAVIAAVVKSVSQTEEAMLSGGDEPPIRVKGGSLDVYLISTSHTWDDGGTGAKVWHIKAKPDRSKDELAVFIDYTTGGPDFVCGNAVNIFHKDTVGDITELEIKSQTKHIQVKRKDNGTKDLKTSQQSLYYDQKGTLDSIKVDAHRYPMLSDPRQLQSVWIFDI